MSVFFIQYPLLRECHSGRDPAGWTRIASPEGGGGQAVVLARTRRDPLDNVIEAGVQEDGGGDSTGG